MRFDRTWVKVVATGIVLAAAVTGCGNDDKTAGDESSGGSETPTPTPTPSGLTGEWTANPGQSDKVQQALTTKGFECTRNADPATDLRVCSTSRLVGKGTDLGGKHIEQVNLRFLSDAQGTVVLAAVEEDNSPKDLEKAVAEAVLPASDAAVYLADGTSLSWGTVDDAEIDLLTIKGWHPSKSVLAAFKPLATTKEKALPTLQAAKLKCEFATTDQWGKPQNSLTCYDPAFKMKDADGSMEGGTAELVLIDDGAGIRQVRIEGRHATIPSENSRAVKTMLPRLQAVDPDQGLQDAAAWVQRHLDNLPHSAYVGQWRIDTSVALTGGLAGWPFVSVSLWQDKPSLGMKGAETPTDSLTPSDSTSPGMTDTPTS